MFWTSHYQNNSLETDSVLFQSAQLPGLHSRSINITHRAIYYWCISVCKMYKIQYNDLQRQIGIIMVIFWVLIPYGSVGWHWHFSRNKSASIFRTQRIGNFKEIGVHYMGIVQGMWPVRTGRWEGTDLDLGQKVISHSLSTLNFPISQFKLTQTNTCPHPPSSSSCPKSAKPAHVTIHLLPKIHFTFFLA
jgi:hypothetical protein